MNTRPDAELLKSKIKFQIVHQNVGQYEIHVTEKTSLLAKFNAEILPNSWSIELLCGHVSQETYCRLHLFVQIYVMHITGKSYIWESQVTTDPEIHFPSVQPHQHEKA